MARPRFLLPVLAMVASLATAAAASAETVGPEGGTVYRVTLELKADHGLHARLETSEKEMVTLAVWRQGYFVSYEAPGEVSATGLKVRFGRLGLIDVAFAPTKTLSSTEPSEECSGEPRTLREGVFSGTIDFSGERGYVRIEGPQAEGSMSVISQWRCPDPITPFGGSALGLLRPGSDEHETETATLSASGRRCSCFFAAGVHHRHSGGRSLFYGAKAEKREGMQIVRVTQAHGPASAFDFDQAKGTATLHAPRPLSGSATFRDRPHGRHLWRSTIRVPLLGAAPLRIGGPGFRVYLSPEYQLD